MSRKKVLIFDPSGTNNYTNMLADSLCKNVELTVIARKGFDSNNVSQYELKEYFLMTPGDSKVKKGFQYLLGHIKTIGSLLRNKYEIVHIEWLLRYRIDLIFLPLIKKHCKKLVYTAHNVYPHVNGRKNFEELSRIYDIADIILVHGKGSRDELLSNFPSIDPEKIYIQFHGADLRTINKSEETVIPDNVRGKITSHKGIIMMFLGVIFNNKGVDRLVHYWNQHAKEHPDDLMIIAGSVNQKFDNFDDEVQKYLELENSLFIPGIVPDAIHDYLYTNCDVILLPYKHASMSGVVFDAARFSKTIVATDVGCIPEYLEPGFDSILTENKDDMFAKELDDILRNGNKQKLAVMGENLKRNILTKYSWERIADYLIKEIYDAQD